MMAKNYNDKKVETVKLTYRDRKYDGNVFTTKMDPQAQATSYPVKYPIVAGAHRPMVDVKYNEPVTDADNVVAIASLKRDGPLYTGIDLMLHPIGFKYLGLAMAEDGTEDPNGKPINLEYNEQFRDMMLESLAAAYATQLTEIEFLTSNYETDIPAMLSGDGAKVGFTVFYQAVIQNLAAIMSSYNSLMMENDYLIKMGYNAEAANTIETLNLFKKANVYSLMTQIGELLSQEYLDLDWFREASMITTIPSRKYDDMLSPMQSISGITRIPQARFSKMGELEATFDTDNDYWKRIAVTFDNQTYYYTFESLCWHIMQLLNPVNIVAHSRAFYNQTVVGAANPVHYVNDFIASVRALLIAFSQFTAAVVPFKTFLMVLQNQTVLNRWVLGSEYTLPSRPRIQIEPSDYVLVEDIIKATFSGGSNLGLDLNTRKWAAVSLWDYDSGIPRFDYYDGGFAIANSVRALPQRTMIGEEHSPMFLFPVMFRPLTIRTYVGPALQTPLLQPTLAYDRKGHKYVITRRIISMQDVNSSIHLARLNIAGSDTLGSLVLPDITLSVLMAEDPVLESNALRFLLNVFGCAGAIIEEANEGPDVVHAVELVSPSVVGVVSRQFTDYAENAMAYLKSRIPLRQSDGNQTIGFSMH